jgi:hypothetical protein
VGNRLRQLGQHQCDRDRAIDDALSAVCHEFVFEL